MNVPVTLTIDRIALTLHGVAPADARLIADGIDAALSARLAVVLGRPPAITAATAPTATLSTALTGPALVDAVAAGIADRIAAELRRPPATGVSVGATPWR